MHDSTPDKTVFLRNILKFFGKITSMTVITLLVFIIAMLVAYDYNYQTPVMASEEQIDIVRSLVTRVCPVKPAENQLLDFITNDGILSVTEFHIFAKSCRTIYTITYYENKQKKLTKP